MTTEVINSREMAVAQANTVITGLTLTAGTNRTNGKTKRGKNKTAKAAVASDFRPAAETHSLFEVLEQHAREREGWDRSMSATLALLKQAHNMLESAEDKIFSQEQRIRQLEKVATTDELTGLLNRRGFYDAFMGEIERCNRGLVQSGLLVLIDLDNFKMVNDTYGHLAGDAALRLVARTLKTEIRAMDCAARLGGDEFVLLLSHTTKRDAASRAQTIGWKLNNLTLTWHGESIPVRASLGLKDFGAGDKADMVFNAADAGLYQEKEARKRQPADTTEFVAEEQPVTA